MHGVFQLIASGKLTHLLFSTFTLIVHLGGESPRQLRAARGGVVCTSDGAVVAETEAGPERIEAPGEAEAWTDVIPRGWPVRSMELGMFDLWSPSGPAVTVDLPSPICQGYPYFVSPDRRVVILEAGERQSLCAPRGDGALRALPVERRTRRVLHAVWTGVDEAVVWSNDHLWGARLRVKEESFLVETAFRPPAYSQPEPWTATVDGSGRLWMTARHEDGRRGLIVADPDEGQWRRAGGVELPEVEMLRVLDGQPLALTADGGVWSVGRQRSVLFVPPRTDGLYATGFCAKKVGGEARIYVSLTTSVDRWVPSTGDSYEVWSAPTRR